MTEAKGSTWLDDWIRRPRRGKRQPEIHALIDAVRKAWELTIAWPPAGTLAPRPGRTTRPIFIDANNRPGPIVEEPSDVEAAGRALEILAADHPALAEKLSAARLAALLPSWRESGENAGRRGKGGATFDGEIVRLASELGLAPMSTDAIRKMRERGILPPSCRKRQ